MCKSQSISYYCGHYYERLVSVCNGSFMACPFAPQHKKNRLACQGNKDGAALIELNYETECPRCLRDEIDALTPQDLPDFPDHEYPLVSGDWGEEVESTMTYFATEKLRMKQALPDPYSPKFIRTRLRRPRMRDWTKNPDFDEDLNPGARLLKKKYRKQSLLRREVKRSDIPTPPKDPFDLSDEDQVATGWGLTSGGGPSAEPDGLDWNATDDAPAASGFHNDAGYAAYVAAGNGSIEDTSSALQAPEHGLGGGAPSAPYGPEYGSMFDNPSASDGPEHDWSDDPTLPHPAPGPPPSEHHVWGGWAWIDVSESPTREDEWDADMVAEEEFDENDFDFGENEDGNEESNENGDEDGNANSNDDSNANIDPLLLAAGMGEVKDPAADAEVPAIDNNDPEPTVQQAADVDASTLDDSSLEGAGLFFAAVEEALEQPDESMDVTSALVPAAPSTAATNDIEHSIPAAVSPAVADDIDHFIPSDFDSSDSDFSLNEPDYYDSDREDIDMEDADLQDHSGPCTRRNPGGFNPKWPIYDVVEKHGGPAGKQAQCARYTLGGPAKQVKTVIEVNKTQGFAIITSPKDETFGERLRQRDGAGKVMTEEEYCVLVWTSKA